MVSFEAQQRSCCAGASSSCAGRRARSPSQDSSASHWDAGSASGSDTWRNRLATFSHDRWLISVPDFAHAARREARPGWGRRWGGWTVQPLRPTDPRHQLSGRSPIDFPRARAQRCRKRRVRGGTRCARRPIIDLTFFSASYTLWYNENVKTNAIMDRMRALEFCDWCSRGR